MGRKKSTDGGVPQSIRISQDLLDRVDMVAARLGMSPHETMRLAMKIGLEDLKRCDYDIAGAILDKAGVESPLEKARSAMGAAAVTLSDSSKGFGTAKAAKKKAAS